MKSEHISEDNESSLPVRLLVDLVEFIERQLADYYGFELLTSATTHLVSRIQLQEALGKDVEGLPEFQARGGVFLVEPPIIGDADDVFIGVYVDADVISTLHLNNPLLRLDELNLNDYCLLIEEISHFHLILNRLHLGRGVSKLEIEWQGEIDKLLVCALTLANQHGHLHLYALTHRLFDCSVLTGVNQELYWQATRHAARFWYRALRAGKGLGTDLRLLLRRAYGANWPGKLEQIDRVAA